ncbi:MAG: TrkA family potassium uptake protein [Candidatus Hydrothermarchaeales archaeon]
MLGAGRVGRHLASLLLERKHEVAIIEKDKDKCQELSQEMDLLVVNGNGTQPKNLEDLNVKNCNVFVAATGKDEVNLLSCLVAKNMGVKSVIARVGNPEYQDVFKKLGIDHVISPEVTASTYIEKLIMRPGVADLAILGRSDVEILEFLVTEDSYIFGREVGSIKSNGFLFIAIYKNSDLIIPTGKTMFKKDDRVLVLLKTEMVKEVERLFMAP